MFKRILMLVAALLLTQPALAADNLIVKQGNGTLATIRSESISSIHYQFYKLASGAPGSVDYAATDGSHRLLVNNSQVTQPISGPVSITDGLATARIRDTAGHDALDVAIIDAAGNQITSFTGSGGTSAQDDAAFTVASGSGTPMMAIATSDSVDSGDAGVLRMDVTRDLFTTIRDSTGADATDTTNHAVKVAIVAGAGGGTSMTDDAAFTVATTGINPMGCVFTSDTIDAGDGGAIRCDANRQPLIVISSAPTGASAVQLQGNIAHDAADAGNPAKIGGRARTSDITAVANDDRVDAQFGTLGELISRAARTDALVSGCANSTGTGDTQIIAAPGAGIRIYLTRVTVTNTSATNSYVSIKSAANIKDEAPAPGSFGGSVIPYGDAPLRMNANEAVNFASTGGGVTTMRVCASGYTAAN